MSSVTLLARKSKTDSGVVATADAVSAYTVYEASAKSLKKGNKSTSKLRRSAALDLGAVEKRAEKPMNLKDELMTDRGRAIGFGRVKIPKIPNFFDIELPLFSFVVIEREDVCLPYIASCIHVPVDGYGNSVKEARVDMAENIGFLLYENFKDVACREHLWENLYLFSKSNPNSCELWDKYHALQYLCAKNGVSVDTANSTLHERIAYLEEKVEELTGKLAEKDFVISALTNTYLLEVFGHTVVEYEEPETKEVLT